MPISIVTAPSAPPITVAQAKQHLRVVDAAEDDLIQIYLDAATSHVQTVCDRAIGEQVWQLTLDSFPSVLELPGFNVSEVQEISYTDPSGAVVVMAPADYRVDLAGATARVTPIDVNGWPKTADVVSAVSVKYKLGGFVPSPLKAAILLIVGDLFENRQQIDMDSRAAVAESPTVRSLLFPWKRVLP